MRILIVDDDPDILVLIAAYLAGAGHVVETTTSSRDASRRLKQDRYDALVTDILLPDIDGLELVRLVRGYNPDIWIVAISGGSDHCIQCSRRSSAFINSYSSRSILRD